MKFKDIRTIKSFIKEYGMNSGKPSYGSNKSVMSPSSSPSTKPSSSPTTKKAPASPTTAGPTKNNQPEILAVRATDVPADAVVKDIKNEPMGKVVSRVGDKPKADALVVDTGKMGKQQYQVLPKDQEVFIDNPEYQEESIASKLLSKLKFKSKKARSIKKILRNNRFSKQKDIVVEINFNSREVAQSALNASIRCGFEAETVWPDIDDSGLDSDTLVNARWHEVLDIIDDQLGRSESIRVEEAFREWLGQSDYFYDIETDVINSMVEDRKEDEDYLDDYVNEVVDSSDVETYREDTLENLKAAKDKLPSMAEYVIDELAEREDWDDAAWGREYVEENKQDEYVEWLTDQIRDNGEHWDDAWQQASEEYDVDDWVGKEYRDDWYAALGDLDIYLELEGGGLSEVASRLEDWADSNSKSNDVETGSYHSGKGVDNTYWRVEEDSSIQGSGAAAEIISPVYDSPAEMLREIKSLFEWMSAQDVETNSSTGLHITMSMAAQEQPETNQLKMALLLGDQYVAKQYGRERNTYTASQMAGIKQHVADLQRNINDEKSLSALEDIVKGGISQGKFSSINFKDAKNSAGNNLIEFRVAGGQNYHTMMDTIVKTVIRYSAVMQAGHEPADFQRDYVKALVKLVTNTGDIDQTTQQKAQQLVDPESIDGNVLSAFQTIAGKKHYTDAIEALNNAYMQLADVQKIRSADPQKELQFEDEAEQQDWRVNLLKAQKYFVRAFAMLASDVASGVNRAPAKSTQIAALRRATDQFGLTPAELWKQIQQSEFYRSFPGDVHSKSEKFASAVNSLLKKQEAKGLQPTFTVKFNSDTQRMFMPGAIADAAFRDIGADIFDNSGKATGNMPQTLSPEHFKVIDDDEYIKTREVRYQYDNQQNDIASDMEVINATRQRQKELPDQASELQSIIDNRMERVKKDQATAAEYKKELDQFANKYGFIPLSIRYNSATSGQDWKLVTNDILSWLSREYNIKFNTNESKMNTFEKFTKLPLEQQLSLLEKIDINKLNEAWSKKKSLVEGDIIGRKLLRRGAYKAAVDILAGVLARRTQARKHSIEYYAARIAQSYPGVNARELTAMYHDLVNETGELSENLRKWFKDKWVRFGPDGKIKGDCARGSDSEGKPKCLPQSKAHSLGKKGRASAAARKRRQDPNPERKGAAKNVATKKESVVEYTNIPFNVCPSCGGDIVHESQLIEKQDACYHKVKSRYKVWPSAYASGALVQCRKKGAKNWGKSKKESVQESAVPDNRKVRILNKIMSRPLLASDIGGQMEAFFAIPDPLMVNEFRKQRGMAGDDIDLRPVVKGFIGSVLHPDVQKQVNVSESIVNEYDDIGKEKQTIIKTISDLDATDKVQASVLDRIYKILNSGQISTNIDTAFSKPLVDENLPEAEKIKIRKDMTKIIAGLEQDYGSMNKFITRLEQQGSVVNVNELAKTLNTFDKVFGDSMAIAAFITLANYGVGKKQKGPGEYALACLSDQIKLAEGEGDLQITGIGKVELKAALSTAGGRIGYGGGSQKSKRAVIDKYAQYLPTVLARLNAGGGGSISIRPFVDALNTDLPTNNPENVKVRKALMSELLTMDLEKFAAPVVEKFATSMNFDEIETEYLIQNFAWYKDRDDFDALLLIHVPNRKTAMIRNAEDLIAFRNSGHANATSISIVPTQAGAGREQWAQLTLNKQKAG